MNGTREPVAFRCSLCPPERVFLRVADARGRRQELRRAARALAKGAEKDHERLFGHALNLVEVRVMVASGSGADVSA